jgi:P pilus assembly chaperone PapD
MELHGRALHADGRLHAHRALTRLVCASAGCLLLLPGWTSPAYAQLSVEVSPLRVELQTAPSGTTTQAVTLDNSGKEPVRVRARVTDWDLSRDGTPQFEGVAENGPFSATTWIRLAPPEIVIDPGKSGIVRFSMNVPADVAPAGYRAAILFEFLPATGDPVARGREVQFRSRIATLIYANIGQPPVNVELVDMSIRRRGEETLVIAVLKNTSKRSIRTKGSLTIFDASGKSVREGSLPDVPVLPESEREVPITAFDASKPLPVGEYRVEVKIDAGMPALIVGETTFKVDK